MPWKLIFHFFFQVLILFRQFIKYLDFFLDDALALLKHLDLGVQLVHFVFVFENHILIDISDFELEVF